MEVIRTKKYLSLLRQIADAYEFPLEAIEVTDDIQRWCNEHGVEENHPFRTGKCIFNHATKKYRILLLSEISDEMYQSIITKMELNGLAKKMTMLTNEKSFSIHLILHEIAHAQHNEWSENCCDIWAFKEMRKWINNQR